MTNFLSAYSRLIKRADEPRYYTIQPVDTFERLDNRYKFRRKSFQLYNPTVKPHGLQIGKRLVIPPQSELLTNGPRIPKGYTYFPSAKLLHRIAEQESSSGRALFGDWRKFKPKAVGLMQILGVLDKDKPQYLRDRRRLGRPASGSRVIDDVNDTWGTNYTLEDRYDYTTYLNMAKKYLLTGGVDFYNKFKRNPTDADYYRMWNGGKNWYDSKKPELINNANNYAKMIEARVATGAKPLPIKFAPKEQVRRWHQNYLNSTRPVNKSGVIQK